MSAVSETLSAHNGPYEWGVRDCVTTANALTDALLGRDSRIDTAPWHTMGHDRAVAKALHRHATLGAAYEAGFCASGALRSLRANGTPLVPGDIVVLAGEVTAGGVRWDVERLGGVLGFVGDSHEVYVFARAGLAPAQGAFLIERLFRCRPA